jgi:hypothetical protein
VRYEINAGLRKGTSQEVTKQNFPVAAFNP